MILLLEADQIHALFYAGVAQRQFPNGTVGLHHFEQLRRNFRRLNTTQVAAFFIKQPRRSWSNRDPASTTIYGQYTVSHAREQFV